MASAISRRWPVLVAQLAGTRTRRRQRVVDATEIVEVEVVADPGRLRPAEVVGTEERSFATREDQRTLVVGDNRGQVLAEGGGRGAGERDGTDTGWRGGEPDSGKSGPEPGGTLVVDRFLRAAKLLDVPRPLVSQCHCC